MRRSRVRYAVIVDAAGRRVGVLDSLEGAPAGQTPSVRGVLDGRTLHEAEVRLQ
jgi:hypothetical protein